MDRKKEPGRFSIKFSTADPAHKMVIDLLNQQSPRGKAQFIANAVLHYIHCSETPDLMHPIPPDSKSIERMVISILKKHNIAAGKPAKPNPCNPKPTPASVPPASALSDRPTVSDTKPNSASLAAISDTLAAFRRQ